MGVESGEGPELVFFAPDVTDTSTIKRAQGFLDQGYGILVFGFQRARYNCDYVPSWPHLLLGRTTDARYGQRLGALVTAVPRILGARKPIRRAKVFYARNIDQLILAYLARMLFNPRAAVVYEVLDIPPILVGRGVVSILLRMVERLCLRAVRLLVLSSPGFYRNYYQPAQRYGGAWFLLENKLHPGTLSFARAIPRRPETRRHPGGYRWAVGYYGLIRGQATFDLMTRLAERLRGQVLFRFRGIVTTVDPGSFEVALRQNPNMIYEGDYVSPDDLAELYGQVDFAWALDLEHVDHNSRWLLPCRYYEAGFFGVPCLTGRGFEVGNLVERLGVGWSFEAPFEETLVRFFETLSPSAYDAVRVRLLTLPDSEFVAGEDIVALCRLLDDRTPSASGERVAQVGQGESVATEPAVAAGTRRWRG